MSTWFNTETVVEVSSELFQAMCCFGLAGEYVRTFEVYISDILDFIMVNLQVILIM